MPGYQNTTAAQEKRERDARMKAEAENVAHAIEDEPLPSPAERREGAAKALWATLHSPRTHDRDRIQAARVILQNTPDTDPMAELAKRIGGSTAALLEFLEGAVVNVRAKLAAEETAAGQPPRFPVASIDHGDGGEPRRHGT